MSSSATGKWMFSWNADSRGCCSYNLQTVIAASTALARIHGSPLKGLFISTHSLCVFFSSLSLQFFVEVSTMSHMQLTIAMQAGSTCKRLYLAQISGILITVILHTNGVIQQLLKLAMQVRQFSICNQCSIRTSIQMFL